MPELDLVVAGRTYRIGCGDGEEVHLVHLASVVDAEAQKLQQSIGNATEGRLMLMTSLMIADKLHESQAGGAAAATAQDNLKSVTAKADALEAELAEARSALAKSEAKVARQADALSKAEAEAERKAEVAITEAKSRAADAEAALAEARAAAASPADYSPEREEEIAANLDALAARIETLASRIDVPA